MPHDDQAYFRQRAREERDRAKNAGDRSAALVHRRLAEQYERAIDGLVTRRMPSG